MIRPLNVIQFSIQSLLLVLLLSLFSCTAPVPQAEPDASINSTVQSASPSFGLEEEGVEKSLGQLVYAPVYSSLRYGSQQQEYNLSATLSIRNTSLRSPITVTKLFYFDSKGNLIRNYSSEAITLSPLESVDYFVEQIDKSGGTGANFIVEWVAEVAVNEPLVEVVMVGVAGTQGISFTSRGKTIGVHYEDNPTNPVVDSASD